jgi:hypothetical protein
MSMSYRFALSHPAVVSVALACPAMGAVVADDFSSNRYGWVGGVGTWERLPNWDWGSAWTTSTNPLTPGSGTYVQFRTVTGGVEKRPGPISAGGYGVRKRMDSAVLDTSTTAHTVSFDFRLESDLTTFNTFDDRLHIFASPVELGNTNANTTWSVGVVGANNGSGITPLYWYFYDRNTSDGFNGANMYFTNVPLQSGVTYSFVIDVDPETASYSASISSSAGSDGASNLGFRNGTAGSAGDFLVFGGNVSATDEAFGFSFDNVIVVPEPSASLLALMGACGFALRRRR